MNNLRILAVDPSGTGTTGIYYRDKWTEKFNQFTGKEWVKHFEFILMAVEGHKPNLILFETSNYVSLRGKDMTSLWKLLGAIEVLPYDFPISIQTKSVPVNQVKGLRGKLLKGSQRVEGIEYRPGKGWHYSGKKISTHELDAYLVYWLWESKAKDKPKTKLASKTISKPKSKAKLKEKATEEELLCDDDLPEDRIVFCPEPDDIDFPEEELEDHE